MSKHEGDDVGTLALVGRDDADLPGPDAVLQEVRDDLFDSVGFGPVEEGRTG